MDLVARVNSFIICHATVGDLLILYNYSRYGYWKPPLAPADSLQTLVFVRLIGKSDTMMNHIEPILDAVGHKFETSLFDALKTLAIGFKSATLHLAEYEEPTCIFHGTPTTTYNGGVCITAFINYLKSNILHRRVSDVLAE